MKLNVYLKHHPHRMLSHPVLLLLASVYCLDLSYVTKHSLPVRQVRFGDATLSTSSTVKNTVVVNYGQGTISLTLLRALKLDFAL